MAEMLLPQARIGYVPGGTFLPVNTEPNHARLSFSGVPDDRLVHGLSGFGRLLQANRTLGRD
jgi:2-aminoadipate transaminase